MNKNKKLIATSFDICSSEHITKLVDKLDNSIYATINYPSCIITLAKTLSGEDINPSQVQVSFYHELAHTIFHNIGRNDLAEDETLVQMVGQALASFINTAEFKDVKELL